ncbi:uncharacterized protein L199_001101 [Kwoniella botswanensis]|uniref:uncharacterized protein n=1 Tax=Kwoniella botswanensis TaxID=1268659 RepID=UPI00315C7F5B
MPTRKTTPAGTSSKSKKAAGLAQPTLTFQSARPSSNTKTNAKSKSTKLQRSEPSLSEIEVEVQKEPLSSRDVSPVLVEDGLKEKEKAKRRLNVKAKEWKGIVGDAKIQMGGLEPIHAGPDTHNDIHHVLRVFDLTSSYGPCVGITRLQRWERAKKWGLNPPEEIRDILTTKEGEDDVRYRENVLYGWV